MIHEKQQLLSLRKDIKKLASPQKAKTSSWFFKTEKGQYGYGDVFVGLTVPEQRILAKKYKDLSLAEVTTLLHSKIHEERLIALFILVLQFGSAKQNAKQQKQIFELYLSNTKYVNNWDLVDSSADKIVGEYLFEKKFSFKRHSGLSRIDSGVANTPQNDTLGKLARSELLWERRIAMIATYQFIKNGKCDETFRIAEMLVNDKHDLIQKAVGWMLREAGKRCGQEVLQSFLKKHYKTMPRTSLRYAIEHFSPELRAKYLSGTL